METTAIFLSCDPKCTQASSITYLDPFYAGRFTKMDHFLMSFCYNILCAILQMLKNQSSILPLMISVRIHIEITSTKSKH